jgi:hypothetical protein
MELADAKNSNCADKKGHRVPQVREPGPNIETRREARKNDDEEARGGRKRIGTSCRPTRSLKAEG